MLNAPIIPKNHPIRALVGAVESLSYQLLGDSAISLLSYGYTMGKNKGYILYTNEAFFDFRLNCPVPMAAYSLKPGVYDWNEILPEDIIQGARDHNIGRAINIIADTVDGGREVFTFCVDTKHQTPLSLLLSNIEWLKTIMVNFKVDAQDMIKTVEAAPISTPSYLTVEHDYDIELIKSPSDKMLLAILDKLSKQEKACLNLLMAGKEVNEIAEELNIRATSVYTYINRIKKKLGCNKKHTLFKLARQRGWHNILS
jgi:DNA-binding CsgD family transcriptional regulator